MSLRVALLLGARANAWHAEVFRELPEDLAPTVVGTTAGRYPVDEIQVPFVALPWANEVGPWWQRKRLGLRYRLRHATTGWEIPLADTGEALAHFDVINTWELFTEWTRVALDEKRRRRVPVVVTVWDNLPFHYVADPRRGPVRARALAEADRFFVVSQRSWAALVLDGVAPERIVRGEPSVDPVRFAPGDGAATRVAHGFTPDDVLVLCVARLEVGKGVRYLIDAMALARRRDPRLKLLLVGSGPEEAPLRARIERLGLGSAVHLVRFAAYAAMPALHRAADLFVLPSVPTTDWHEQWGQSLIEAMATGTACIASASGGVPETLGDAGMLVAPGDPVATAEALEQLAGDGKLRAEFGQRARERVVARLSHHHQAALLAQLYRELAARA